MITHAVSLATPAINPAQCRAARGLLGWTQKDLARETGLSKTSIVQFETALTDSRHETRRQIAEAFIRFGVEFTPPSGVNRQTRACRVFADDHAMGYDWPVFLQSLAAAGHSRVTLVNWPDFAAEYTTRAGVAPVVVQQDDATMSGGERIAMIGPWMIVPLPGGLYRLALHQTADTAKSLLTRAGT